MQSYFTVNSKKYLATYRNFGAEFPSKSNTAELQQQFYLQTCHTTVTMDLTNLRTRKVDAIAKYYLSMHSVGTGLITACFQAGNDHDNKASAPFFSLFCCFVLELHCAA